MFHSVQCYGRNIDIADLSKTVFSPDGSKLLRTAYYGACDIFDFDRCTGELSNFIPIDTFHVIDSASGAFWDGITSAEISPNNQFIYLNCAYFVLQYDLSMPNINATIDTVGAVDYFVDTVPQHTSGYSFYLSQTGPDGKIYIGPLTGNRFFSTIENPNGKGDLCKFKLRSIQVPKWIELTIPYFPNYRLGRLIGSACDTVYNNIKPLCAQTPWLKVYPNPATDMVRFEYNWIEWEKVENLILKIEDLAGRLVYEQEVPRYTTRQEVNVKGLPAGVYAISLKDGNRQLAVCKMTKQ